MSNANFTQNRGTYKILKPLRYWCQKVLPLVYDDALSYYEVLSKVTYTLNKVIENNNAIIENLDNVTEYIEIIAKETVDKYFEEHDLPTLVDEAVSEIANERFNKSNYLAGKKIVVYGDSLAARSNSYINMLSNNYGCDITNRSVSGTSLVNEGLPLINSANDLDDFDLVIICFGWNDWQRGYKADTMTNTSFCGALRIVLNKLTNIPVDTIVCFSWYGTPGVNYNSYNVNTLSGWTYDNYIDEGISVCEEYSVKYLNFYPISNDSRYSYDKYLINDNPGHIHGYDLINEICAKMLYSGFFNNGRCSNEKQQEIIDWLPLDYSFCSRSTFQTLCANTQAEFRDTKIVSTSNTTHNRLCYVNSSNKVKFSGYFTRANDTSNIEIGIYYAYTQTYYPIITITSPGYFKATVNLPDDCKDFAPYIKSSDGGWVGVSGFRISARHISYSGGSSIKNWYNLESTNTDIVIDRGGEISMTSAGALIRDFRCVNNGNTTILDLPIVFPFVNLNRIILDASIFKAGQGSTYNQVLVSNKIMTSANNFEPGAYLTITDALIGFVYYTN